MCVCILIENWKFQIDNEMSTDSVGEHTDDIQRDLLYDILWKREVIFNSIFTTKNVQLKTVNTSCNNK